VTFASQQQSISAENCHSNIRIATINLFNFIEPPLAFYDFENIYSHGIAMANGKRSVSGLASF